MCPLQDRKPIDLKSRRAQFEDTEACRSHFVERHSHFATDKCLSADLVVLVSSPVKVEI